MMERIWSYGVLIAAFAALAGCSKPADTKTGKAPLGTAGAAQVAKDDEHKHDAWWCAEHGVPEEECSMCSSKVAAECKKKGDWCEKHDRAKSQCFVCDPSLKDRFAAKYRAKYGKEPPPFEDEKKDEGKEPNKKG